MVAFSATLVAYIYSAMFNGTLSYYWLGVVCVVFAFGTGYIAYRGITTSTLAAILINVIQIVSLVSISVLFIVYRFNHPHGGYEIVNAVHVIIPHSYVNMLYQSTIAILLLVGFESITALGAETIRPERDIRRGVLISLIIQGGICYMFEYFASNFAIGKATISSGSGKTLVTGYAAAATNSAPIGAMLKSVGDTSLNNSGTTVSVVVAFTVLLALIGTTLACLNTAVRVTYAMAKDKEMPGLLGLLHGRFATPHAGIWILVTLSAALGIFGANPHQVDNLTQITLASNTGTFLVYGFTCVIAVVAFASRHDKHLVKHIVIPGVGALMNIAELIGVVYIAVNASGTSPGERLQGARRRRHLDPHRGGVGALEPEHARHEAAPGPGPTIRGGGRDELARNTSRLGGRGARAPRPPDVRGVTRRSGWAGGRRSSPNRARSSAPGVPVPGPVGDTVSDRRQRRNRQFGNRNKSVDSWVALKLRDVPR